MLTATFDIGTTAVKGVLVSSDGSILLMESQNIETLFDGGRTEQRPEDWYAAFKAVSGRFLAQYPGIDAVIMSGQMQDVIPVRKDGSAAGNAILYCDGRAEEEAQQLKCACPDGYLRKVTGNHYDGSLSLPKIMWLKKHEPEIFREADGFLISAKDYIIFRLTGKMAGDVIACSTAGAMDIEKKRWDGKLLKEAGVPEEKMPALFYPHQVVGTVSAKAAAETGYGEQVKVYAGMGDAGATTLASGITGHGEYNINLGTSGWVAAVSDQAADTDGGVFNLAAFRENAYINVVPFLNAGNVHHWISGVLSPGQENDVPDYEHISGIIRQVSAGSGGVFFLPYLNGERFPVMDTAVRGTFLGITPSTGKGELARSCLEGVAFSIRQGIEELAEPVKKLSVIGGGGREPVWNQILADVLGQDVYVYRNPDTLPALALCSAVLLEQKKIGSYQAFTEKLQQEEYAVKYTPDEENVRAYGRIFREYVKIYPAVRDFYHRTKK